MIRVVEADASSGLTRFVCSTRLSRNRAEGAEQAEVVEPRVRLGSYWVRWGAELGLVGFVFWAKPRFR